jgi:hypothetical protein
MYISQSKERLMIMSDKIKYLWEVPCNLWSKPEKYKVIKETEKTYLIGKYTHERVLKSRMGTNYVRYFESEEEAWEYYNTGKEQERNRAIARDMANKLRGKGRFVLEYELVVSEEKTLGDFSYFFEEKSNTEAEEFAKKFLEKKNAELATGKYVQKSLFRLVLVEETKY